MIDAGIAKVTLVDKVNPVIQLHSIAMFWDMQMQICTTCIPKSQNGIEVRSLCRRIVAYIKWERRAVEVEKFKSNNESILAKECCEVQ